MSVCTYVQISVYLCDMSNINMDTTAQSQAFLGAVFDTLLYQLTDSLQRITSVKKFEMAKEDSKYHN